MVLTEVPPPSERDATVALIFGIRAHKHIRDIVDAL